MRDHVIQISDWDFQVLAALRDVPETDSVRRNPNFGPGLGWLNNVDVREALGSKSLETRSALERLAASGFLLKRTLHTARHYKISPSGLKFLLNPEILSETIDNESWTGIVSPTQVVQCLSIVSEMEDVCERMTNNHDRAQIFGLIRALEILLTIPDPPRVGVVSLLRDPAFNNIVQVGTFIAALIAAVRP